MGCALLCIPREDGGKRDLVTSLLSNYGFTFSLTVVYCRLNGSALSAVRA